MIEQRKKFDPENTNDRNVPRMRKMLFLVYKVAILWLSVGMFFSYSPLIEFGNFSATNLEFSVAEISLVVFDLISLILVGVGWQNLRKWSARRKIWSGISLLFPIWTSLQLFWAENSFRAGLTVGLIWAIFVAIWSFLTILPEVILGDEKKRAALAGVLTAPDGGDISAESIPKEAETRQKVDPTRVDTDNGFWRRFWRFYLFGAGVVSAWCWIQCVLDLAGASRSSSLMCAGCVTEMFGFPHPNGFAIEPQFMGNLLIVPCFVALYLWIQSLKSGFSYKKQILRGIFAGFFVSTLFLTMSRGAIYGFLIGLVVWGLTGCLRILRQKDTTAEKSIKKEQGWRVLTVNSARVLGIIIAGFLFSLNAQGIFAASSKTNDTYRTGVAKVISQLSLGKIELKNENSREDGGRLEVEDGEGDGEIKIDTDHLWEESNEETAKFDGYVETSTDTRLYLAEAGILTSRQSSERAWFGVGLGGAGVAMAEAGFIATPNEIVQNEYVSLLLETGIVGLLLFFVSIFALIFVASWGKIRNLGGGFWGALVAFAVTICFFSGIPNSIHIPIMLALISITSSHRIRARTSRRGENRGRKRRRR